MPASFLLRFEEHYLEPETTSGGDSRWAKTETKVYGEGPDRVDGCQAVRVLPIAASQTQTAIRGEGPDFSGGESTSDLLPRVVSAKDNLTYTFVNAEEPRRDERRFSGLLVLPKCC
jgi:hypothetical protein